MTEPYSKCMSLAVAELRQAQKCLQDEIRSYPSPIAGCDVAFNRMYADRERVSRALQALDAEVFVATPQTPSPGAEVESR